MKTKELINNLSVLGYSTKTMVKGTNNDKVLLVYNSIGVTISRVPLSEYGQLDTYYTAFPHAPKLLNLLTEYVLTEVKEREDEKKYYVHLLPGEDGYLNVGLNSGKVVANSLVNFGIYYSGLSSYGYKMSFTEDEYNKVQNKYSEYLPKFDMGDKRFELVDDREDDQEDD